MPTHNRRRPVESDLALLGSVILLFPILEWQSRQAVDASEAILLSQDCLVLFRRIWLAPSGRPPTHEGIGLRVKRLAVAFTQPDTIRDLHATLLAFLMQGIGKPDDSFKTTYARTVSRVVSAFVLEHSVLRHVQGSEILGELYDEAKALPFLFKLINDGVLFKKDTLDRREAIQTLEAAFPELPERVRNAVHNILEHTEMPALGEARAKFRADCQAIDAAVPFSTHDFTVAAEAVWKQVVDILIDDVNEVVHSQNATTAVAILNELRDNSFSSSQVRTELRDMPWQAFFDYFDEKRPNMTSRSLTDIFQTWLLAQEGRAFDNDYETRKAFADGVQQRARQLGFTFRCPKPIEGGICGRAATFQCSRAGKSPAGIFALRHTVDGKRQRHLLSVKVPRLILFPISEKK